MYQSPIEVLYNDVKCRFEEGVFKAIQNVDINVNKDELIKALQYDREQYDKGYYDGLLAKSEAEPIVRCKDCAHWLDDWETSAHDRNWHYCAANDTNFSANEYCSRGERREEVEE